MDVFSSPTAMATTRSTASARTADSSSPGAGREPGLANSPSFTMSGSIPVTAYSFVMMRTTVSKFSIKKLFFRNNGRLPIRAASAFTMTSSTLLSFSPLSMRNAGVGQDALVSGLSTELSWRAGMGQMGRAN